MTRAIILLLALLILASVLSLAYSLTERIDDSVNVATTSQPTPSTTWPVGPPTTLPEGFTGTTTTVVKVIAPKSKRSSVYPTDELLHALAMCETGGTMDQHATSKSGRYLSFFQWSIQTWRAAGGEGDPRDASYEYQVGVVRRWILRAGWRTQFPVCARVIGAVK